MKSILYLSIILWHEWLELNAEFGVDNMYYMQRDPRYADNGYIVSIWAEISKDSNSDPLSAGSFHSLSYSSRLNEMPSRTPLRAI